jgi:hypothetical protein
MGELSSLIVEGVGIDIRQGAVYPLPKLARGFLHHMPSVSGLGFS